MSTMEAMSIHDRDRIESFLRRDSSRNVYQLGDLDDKQWPYSNWYALSNGHDLISLALVYTGLAEAILLAMGGDEEHVATRDLIAAIKHLLPRNFYCHVDNGLARILESDYRMIPHGKHLKMILQETARLNAIDTSVAVPLSVEDAEELQTLYAAGYPNHGFDASILQDCERRVLDMGQYYGVRGEHGLVSVAGTHVYSEQYEVAVLGNITTHPNSRRKGYAKVAIAAVCKNLLRTCRHIGLNVKADHHAAIACYRKLGFAVVGEYEEFSAKSPREPDSASRQI